MEDAKLTVASQHLDYTRKVENDMVLRVRRLLSPILGDDNFKTEVSADLDFSEIEQAQESFNPDRPPCAVSRPARKSKRPWRRWRYSRRPHQSTARFGRCPEVAKAPDGKTQTTSTEQSNSAARLPAILNWTAR